MGDSGGRKAADEFGNEKELWLEYELAGTAPPRRARLAGCAGVS